MKIALDVDGVLADVILPWIEHNNSKRKKISKSDIASIGIFGKNSKLIDMTFIRN